MLDSRILYEDNHLIAVNKACSEIVQGDKTGDETLAQKVSDYIKQRDKKPGNVFIGICHRLDRPTSGIVIFAKTSKALSRMNALFRNSEVKKTYWAICGRQPDNSSGTLVHYLLRNQRKNMSRPVNPDTPGAKRAELGYELVAASDRYYLLRVYPATGRHHQIRAQLSAVGCPIKGDLKYGAPRSNKGGGISLHAGQVSFLHPVRKNEVVIQAPPPDEPVWNVFASHLITSN